MPTQESSNGPERLAAFSDGVIAILITIMVLDLRPPHGVGLSAIWPLWPMVASYALSFLFLGITWINHHQLLRMVDTAEPALIWANLAFLFAMSFVPFGTAYVAEQRLAPFTVALYACIFLAATLAFIPMEAVVARQNRSHPERSSRGRSALYRNLVAMLLYVAAIPCAYLSRWFGFALILASSLLYFAPQKYHERP
jgi:uncharacterized membrane protein